MRNVRYTTLFLAILSAPLWAGVDDDWKDLYSQAVHEAALKDYTKAELTYAKALTKAEVFGKEDPRVASTLQGLATMLREEKKLTEAEDASKHAVAIYAVNPGEGSQEYGEVLSLLSSIYMAEGKYQLELQSLQKAVPLLQTKLGPDSDGVIESICMLGDAYRQMKMFASAEPALRHCADLRLDNGGPATPEFGDAANSLAIVYQHLGKYKEADRNFSIAATIREHSLGIQSLELAETLEAYAQLLHQMGRDADAKKKERMAAAIRAHLGKK